MVNVQGWNLDARRIQRGAVHDRCRPGNRKGPTCTIGVEPIIGRLEESWGPDHMIVLWS